MNSYIYLQMLPRELLNEDDWCPNLRTWLHLQDHILGQLVLLLDQAQMLRYSKAAVGSLPWGIHIYIINSQIYTYHCCRLPSKGEVRVPHSMWTESISVWSCLRATRSPRTLHGWCWILSHHLDKPPSLKSVNLFDGKYEEFVQEQRLVIPFYDLLSMSTASPVSPGNPF